MLAMGKADVKPKAAKIISDIRTVKAAALMFRLDNGNINGGADISVVKPYASPEILNNDDVTYSFMTIDGQTYHKVNLGGVEDKVK